MKLSRIKNTGLAAILTGMAVSLAAPDVSHAAMDRPVRLAAGLAQGVAAPHDARITVFKGLPYATAPVGDLRWRPPQAPATWQGVRTADHFGPECPQETRPDEQANMSEDCLYANVWTGAASADEKRPVLVWIYGGGFTNGAGSQPEFDGEGLARKGVIVVTFNYRMGALGFLATPELDMESGHDASGNYGLLDDIAMLKWVKANISAFGGDPDNVTIAGQSAGAGSCGFLAMSPLAKGLFGRAILESHARYPRDLELRYLSVSLRTKAAAEAAGQKFIADKGARSIADMRALPWQALIVSSGASDDTVYTGSTAKPPLFRPVIDGWVLPRGYQDTYDLGTQNDVFIIAGNNKDETGAVPETAFDMLRQPGANPFRPGMPHTSVTLKDYLAYAHEKFGAMAEAFMKLYPAATDQEAALANDAAARDNSRISTWLWGREWTKATSRPVFTYFWTHAPPGPGHDRRGAYHGSEINYVFNNLYATNKPWTDEDRRIADRMSSYWVNFIKTGNPNGPGPDGVNLPVWPQYDAHTPQVMALGDQWQAIPIADPAKIDFWTRFMNKQDAW